MQSVAVSFACKRRGICPSCGARRMCGTAAHLVDRVLPDVPLRQWVLSLPFPVRRLAAFRADVARDVVRIFAEVVLAGYRRRLDLPAAPGGAVSFLQRAGGSLNLNLHIHQAALDGLYLLDPGGRPVFQPAPPPSPDDLAWVADRVRARILRRLRRLGLLAEADDAEGSNECPERSALDACADAALDRGEFAPLRADGRPVEPDPDDERFALRSPGRWAARADGFDVHAGVRIESGDDQGRERLCRYAGRPALALDRIVALPDGRVAYRPKWARGRAPAYRVMSPVEFLARLAAIVPPPRYPLVRYHGVLAPASPWRASVVPRPREEPAGGVHPAGCLHETRGGHDGPGLPPVPPNPRGAVSPATVPPAGDDVLLLLPPAPVGPPELPNVVTLPHWRRLLDGLLYAREPRLDWATLLARTHGTDALACPRCGGRLRLLDVVTDRADATAVAEALDLTWDLSALRGGRGPPDPGCAATTPDAPDGVPDDCQVPPPDWEETELAPG